PYYQQFYEKKIQDGEFSQRPGEMAKNVQIATVLYEVLKTMVNPSSIEEKTRRYAEDVENKRGQYEHYNILPLYAVGVKPAIMELPEIKAAIAALCKVDNLPMPVIRARSDVSNDDSTRPMDRLIKVNDILDWIASVFGFQKGNVANQREHLILLLANMNIRDRAESSCQLHAETVEKLMVKILKNYDHGVNLCIVNPILDYDEQQFKLIYIALYLLIWGEASNVRFMPECLCYIFHHMCHEVYNILEKSPSRATRSTELIEGHDGEYFLREVITPIYEVLRKEAKRNNKGKASHTNWRNYDDLNEYFWSKQCFDDLKWPLDPKADFFRHSDETAHWSRAKLCLCPQLRLVVWGVAAVVCRHPTPYRRRRLPPPPSPPVATVYRRHRPLL
ncbi:putative callose synthase 6, partial [Mucuna pruriens]